MIDPEKRKAIYLLPREGMEIRDPPPPKQPKNRKKPTEQEEEKLRAAAEQVDAYPAFALKPMGREKHRFIRGL